MTGTRARATAAASFMLPSLIVHHSAGDRMILARSTSNWSAVRLPLSRRRWSRSICAFLAGVMIDIVAGAAGAGGLGAAGVAVPAAGAPFVEQIRLTCRAQTESAGRL